MSSTITLDQFRKIYDIGDNSSGCSCNKAEANDGNIESAEVFAHRDNYAQLANDFKRLSVEDQDRAANLFSPKVAHKLALQVEPDFAQFQKQFDNGEGFGASEDNYIYEFKEVGRGGGGFMSFFRLFNELSPLVQRVVKPHITHDVAYEMKKSISEMFWSTYDNGKGGYSAGGDARIDIREIASVGKGWANFLEDLSYLSKSEGLQEVHEVLDALSTFPEKAVLRKLAVMFPEYLDPYNLDQFPKVNWGVHEDRNRAMNAIYKIFPQDVEEISLGTIPEFPHRLTVNADERFYVALRTHLEEKTGANPDYRVDIYTLAKLYKSETPKVNRASLGELKLALKEDPNRYYGIPFVVNATAKYGVISEEDFGTPHEIQCSDDSNEGRKMIDTMIKAGIKYTKEQSKQVVRGSRDEGPKSIDVARYTFIVPKREVLYVGQVCDADDACMPLVFQLRYKKYTLDRVNNNVVVNNFDRDRFNAHLTNQKEGLSVFPDRFASKIDLGDSFSGNLSAGDWVLIPVELDFLK